VRSARARFALAAGGLGLLIGAQTQLQFQRLPSLAAVALAGGLLLTLAAAYAAPERRAVREPQAAQLRAVRPLPLVLSVGLAVATWFTTNGGVYTLANVAAWLAALATWLWAWWPVRTISETRARLWWVPLLAVVVLGAFFRFYHLASVPGDPTSDQAEKLLDISDIDHGQHSIFFARNAGREPAQFYFTYFLMKVFGLSLSFETLKIGTAFVGVVAIAAVFLFASEVAGRLVGLVAATLFAVSKWPIATARIGLRFPYAPLATALALWLLFRYLRQGDRRDALACGLAVGLGLHGYTPFRVVPLLVLFLLALAVLRVRSEAVLRRTIAADGALLFGGALLACLPLLHYAVRYWDAFSYRAATRTETQGFADTVATIAENTLNGLLAFNWRGDRAWVVSLPLDPLLDVVTAGALLAGLVLVCHRAARRDFVSAALLVSGLVLLLPSTLNLAFPIENPSANRLTAAAPVVFTIAALPFSFLWDSLRAAASQSRLHAFVPAALAALAAGLVVLAAQQNYARYFHDYKREYDTSAPNSGEIAAAMRKERERGVALDDMYLLGYPNWVDARNIGFALGDVDWYVDHAIAPEAPVPPVRDTRPALFVLYPDDPRLRELRARLAHGTYTLFRRAPEKHTFALYSIR
jgi:hypothetical protein